MGTEMGTHEGLFTERVRPATSLTEALAGREGVVSVGDCVTPAKVGEAINAGFMAALTI